nr:MAG TPA: hypothetical protein [Caudoviricetes sp.]
MIWLAFVLFSFIKIYTSFILVIYFNSYLFKSQSIQYAQNQLTYIKSIINYARLIS